MKKLFIKEGTKFGKVTFIKESGIKAEPSGGSNCLQKPHNIHRNRLKTLALKELQKIMDTVEQDLLAVKNMRVNAKEVVNKLKKEKYER